MAQYHYTLCKIKDHWFYPYFTKYCLFLTSLFPFVFANYTDNVSTYLLLYVALAQWNPVSRETFLLNNTYIALDLESLRNLSLVDVFTSRNEYTPGENITLFIDIVNIGGFNTSAYIKKQ